MNNGTPKEKLILGLGTYGRSLRLVDPSRNSPGDAAAGGGTAGAYTREAGFLSYYEICQKLSQGWTKKWDDEAKVPYAHSGNEWVGYDDIQSLKVKVDYLKQKGLGGAMFWALDLDDFNGQFCGQGKYPLINSVKSNLNNGVIPPVTSTVATTTLSTVVPTSISVITNGVSTTTKTTTTTQASSTTSTTTVSSICKNGDGYYQDVASGCKNYIICAFTATLRPIIKVLSCADGLLFDIDTMGCNYASLVKCYGGSVEGKLLYFNSIFLKFIFIDNKI